MKKKYLFYTLYSLAALIFFLYWLFPSAEMKNYIEHRVRNAGTGYSLHIGNLRPVLPPGLQFLDAEVREGDRLLVEADQVKFMPCFLSLFGDSPATDFRIDLYAGTVKGRASLKKESAEKGEGEKISLEAALSGIQAEQIEILQNLSGHPISGILEGTVAYRGNEAPGSGEADLKVRDLTVELGTPLLSLGKLTFAEVSAKLGLENQQLQIRECTAKGNQAGGNLAGTVELKNPAGKSILNLAGSIRPHPSLIAQMGEGVASLLFKSKRGGGDLPFAVRGTLEKPLFSMQ